MQRRADHRHISYGTLRRAFKLMGCKVRKQKNRWFWTLPDLPESECDEELNERIGVADGESCEIPQATAPNWLEVLDAEVEELAVTNEMELV
jgi:hypothetical protein